MAIVRSVLELLLNPFFIALLLLLLSLLVFRGRRQIRGLSVAFLLLMITGTSWLPHKLTSMLEGRYPIVQHANPAIGWIVVLSGGQSDQKNQPANMVLYSASIKRLIEGLRLYRQIPDAKLLLSGGGYGFDIPEANRLNELAGWFEIPLGQRVLEVDSVNTADQALAVKKIVGDQAFYLVTSAIHMPRAMALFQAAGLNPVPAPTDFTSFWNDERWGKRWIPNPYNLFYFSIAWHEILGRLYTHLPAPH